jgi:cation-transporting ATPase 13A2
LYLFIVFSISLWTYEEYYYYAGVIFITSAVSIGINLFQIRQLNEKIFHMAYYDIPLNVLRENNVLQISSVDVVPGDIVFLKDAIKLPFEGIILEGSALINECALTG